MEGFEEFDQYHSRSVKTLFITIQRRGNFSLNRASFKALGSPKAVKLLFNRTKRQIAFLPTTATDFRSVPVRRQGGSDSYLIAGLTFCKEYDIDTTTARRYEAEMRQELLIIDLNAPSTDATGPRLRNDVSEGLKGKQERRLARRISEKTLSSSDEFDDGNQSETEYITESQDAIPLEEDEDALSQEDKAALENALKKGDLSSIRDILNLLGYPEGEKL